MKKPYQKPMLYAETFELVEHIAACSPSSNVTLRQNDSTCIFTTEDGRVLYSNPGACYDDFSEDYAGQYSDFAEYFDWISNYSDCYTVLTGKGTPFSS